MKYNVNFPIKWPTEFPKLCAIIGTYKGAKDMKKLLFILFFLFCTTTFTEAEELSIQPIWEENEQIQGTTDGTVDYYTISLEKDQRVTFTFQHVGDAKLQIWTSDNKAITISIKDLEGDRSVTLC